MGQLATQCPHCRARIQLKNAEWAGKNVKCPACGEPFIVKPLALAPAAGPTQQQPVACPVSSAVSKPSQTTAAARSSAAGTPARSAARKSSALAKAPTGDIDFPVAEPLDEVEIVDADEIVDEP